VPLVSAATFELAWSDVLEHAAESEARRPTAVRQDIHVVFMIISVQVAFCRGRRGSTGGVAYLVVLLCRRQESENGIVWERRSRSQVREGGLVGRRGLEEGNAFACQRNVIVSTFPST
jgi:hypothetical protein